jgi:hypothetical protein
MSLTEAAHDAEFLVDDLTRANLNAHPVVHIVLLEMIGRAARLKADIEALQSAIGAGHERHLRPHTFPGEAIHHINGDIHDNSPENIKIVRVKNQGKAT